MPWAPGQSGNPKGYDGPRRRRNQEVLDEIKARGHLNPLITLSEIHNDPNKEPAVRVAAAGMLAPFLNAKLQSIATPRFVETPIQVPEFTDVSVAESFLAKIATLVAGGELDIQTGLELSTLTKNWLDARHAAKELEMKVISVEGGPTEQTIRVVGGLPELPGTNVTMPVLHGKPVTNGHAALAAPTDAVPAIESTPSQPSNDSTNGNCISPGATMVPVVTR
jgi:hypothetical protein